jgi:hypothetical protein
MPSRCPPAKMPGAIRPFTEVVSAEVELEPGMALARPDGEPKCLLQSAPRCAGIGSGEGEGERWEIVSGCPCVAGLAPGGVGNLARPAPQGRHTRIVADSAIGDLDHAVGGDGVGERASEVAGRFGLPQRLAGQCKDQTEQYGRT